MAGVMTAIYKPPAFVLLPSKRRLEARVAWKSRVIPEWIEKSKEGISIAA